MLMMMKNKLFKKMNVNNVLIVLVISLVIFCSVLSFMNRNSNEGFENPEDPVIDEVNKRFEDMSEDELSNLFNSMQSRLARYGLLPEKMEHEVDRSQWVPKSQLPPAGPRVDMSQYVRKSSIPPEKVCPPQKEVDYSQYVKKSTLPPTQKCPPCIAPKVQVSAGLCRKCPPCPKCPPPQRCPTVTCPEPQPVEQKECPKCSEIKYIKVPTIITRTIVRDSNNNVIEEKEERHTDKPTAVSKSEAVAMTTNAATTSTKATPTRTSRTVVKGDSDDMVVPEETRVANETKGSKCNAYGLNSAFKRFGLYGPVN